MQLLENFVRGFRKSHLKSRLNTLKNWCQPLERLFFVIQIDGASRCWQCSHFLMKELAVLSTRATGTSYKVNVHNRGTKPVDTRVWGFLAARFCECSSSLSCLTWFASLKLASYQHPKLLTDTSSTAGIELCSLNSCSTADYRNAPRFAWFDLNVGLYITTYPL